MDPEQVKSSQEDDEELELDNDLILNSNKKLSEFIHDLKEAIQNGSFPSSSSKLQSNVDNLSNQTFSYIINWLKLNKHKIENMDNKKQEENEEGIDLNSKKLNSNSTETENYMNEIKNFKLKLKQIESERDRLLLKLNETQQENLDLKSKLYNSNLSLKNQNPNSSEIEKLNKIIQELVLSNEEKDRKVEELTKQVMRFKRIQEIVLSAQNTANAYQPNKKNFDDFDLNTDQTNQDILVQKEDDFNTKLNVNNNNSNTNNNNNNNNNNNQNLETIALSQCQLIANSCSLSSSISSSSSGTSNSLNSVLTPTPNAQTSNSNQAQLQAPLATISEFTSYSSCSSTTVTLTPKLETTNSNNSKSTNENQFNSLSLNNKTKNSILSKKNSLNNNQTICSTTTTSASNKSSKYQSAVSLNQNSNSLLSPTKTTNNSSSNQSSNKSIRQFFGKLIRTSLVNINDSNFSNQNFSKLKQNETLLNSNNFKRGGFRATANARLQSNPNLDTLTFSKWETSQVCEYLNKNGFEMYFKHNQDGTFSHKWIKNGLHLLQATQNDYERELGIKNALHRKKLSLFLQSLLSNSHNLSIEYLNLNKLDQYWVLRWLDDIGLPQYKDVFNECMIDGRILMHINNEDLQSLNINSELHYLSIKRAIHVLRLNNFDPQCLRRRPSGDEFLDKSEVMLWTNHRVMEWLRSIDLSEYAPNLRGSGVHGGLMVFEARFNSTVLADILSIPSSKTLLRRHLTTLFNDLIGPQMLEMKKNAESQPGYQQLSLASKVKHVKKSSISTVGSLFGSSHKRTKSQDSKDFLGLSPLSILNQDRQLNSGQSSTLPINFNEPTDKSKLTLLSNENVPTSIV